MITKTELDKLAEKYETSDFIKDDPIQFMYRFKNKKDSEIAGFIASTFAFGNRKMFIKILNNIFDCCDNDLLGYILNGDFVNLKGVYYRLYKDTDIIALFKVLHKLYNESSGLEELFSCSYQVERGEKYDIFLQKIVDYFYENAPQNVGQGFCHMIPNPKNGGAMKKMNMFLRWVIRKSPVDLGLWSFMKPSELYIPLDVHVARQSRSMGLLSRKSNDYSAVRELTENLKTLCPDDPVKYDFAMFAFGVESSKNKNAGV